MQSSFPESMTLVQINTGALIEPQSFQSSWEEPTEILLSLLCGSPQYWLKISHMLPSCVSVMRRAVVNT